MGYSPRGSREKDVLKRLGTHRHVALWNVALDSALFKPFPGLTEGCPWQLT